MCLSSVRGWWIACLGRMHATERCHFVFARILLVCAFVHLRMLFVLHNILIGCVVNSSEFKYWMRWCAAAPPAPATIRTSWGVKYWKHTAFRKSIPVATHRTTHLQMKSGRSAKRMETHTLTHQPNRFSLIGSCVRVCVCVHGTWSVQNLNIRDKIAVASHHVRVHQRR